MLIDFCHALRAAGLPVSIREYLTLLDALRCELSGPSVEDFYVLSRCALVKSETHFDRFDRVFGAYIERVRRLVDFTRDAEIVRLYALLRQHELATRREALEGIDWDELVAALRRVAAEQDVCPGACDEATGASAATVTRDGNDVAPDSASNRRDPAVAGLAGLWDARQFRDYDDTLELGTRNIKVALRRLRRFTREGADEELDLAGTIRATAANAGYVDIRMMPQRHNRPSVLLLMDVGGTMDEHVNRVATLFSAAKSEFRRLEFFYFHNCVYEAVWKGNGRRYSEKTPTWDLIRRYGKRYLLILVGDATMSPSEILQPGGGVEYDNKESGMEWMQRLLHAFPKHVWINPEPERVWGRRESIGIVRRLVAQRMVPLTVEGLDVAMRLLNGSSNAVRAENCL